MGILVSKWFLGVVVLATVLTILYLMGRKSVHAELTIPSDAQTVWSVLMDVPRHKEWNPVLIPQDGEFETGAKILYKMIQPGRESSQVEAKVVQVVEDKRLNQVGGIPGILTFNHTWSFEPVNGGTRVTQHEEYRGIGVVFWDPGWVERAYQHSLIALRDFVSHGGK